MKEFVRLLVAGSILVTITGVAVAQVPAVDVFGGYSYLEYDEQASTLSNAANLKLNGWNASASFNLFHHIGIEADFVDHQLSTCGGVAGVNCSDFAYMFGPRYTFGDRSKKATAFVHALIGRDQAKLLGQDVDQISDTATAVVVGGGFDYWVLRHVGIQLGPIDLFHTNHLNNDSASAVNSLMAAAGVAFRFGGDFPLQEPKAPKQASEKPESHRSWKHPWRKTITMPTPAPPTPTSGAPQTQAQTQTPPQPARKPAPAPGAPMAAGRGMSVHALGITAAPHNFDGARVLAIEPGSIAEMASLHVGDMITSVDDKQIKTPMELAAELSEKTGKVRIGIKRGKLATETVVILGAQ